MPARLLLDERILGDGRVARAWAFVVGESLVVEDEDGVGGELPLVALERVMERYGRELDPSVPVEGELLSLPHGQGLRRMRYRAAVDAISRDYLVWQRDGAPPLAVLATHATAALKFLLVGKAPV